MEPLGPSAIPERLRSRVSERIAPRVDSIEESKVSLEPDSSSSEEQAAVDRLQQIMPDQPRRAIVASLRHHGGSAEAALMSLLDGGVAPSEASQGTAQRQHIGKTRDVSRHPFPELREDSAMHLRMKELVRLRSWDMYDDEYDDTMDMEATYAVDDGAEEDEERQSKVASVPGTASTSANEPPPTKSAASRATGGAAGPGGRGQGSRRGRGKAESSRGGGRGHSRGKKRGSSRGGRGDRGK